jgi:hypothetical protein
VADTVQESRFRPTLPSFWFATAPQKFPAAEAVAVAVGVVDEVSDSLTVLVKLGVMEGVGVTLGVNESLGVMEAVGETVGVTLAAMAVTRSETPVFPEEATTLEEKVTVAVNG